MNFQPSIPENIRFGNGCRNELISFLRPGNCILICGKHSAPMLQKSVLPMLRNFAEKAELHTVSAEIPLAEVETIAAAAKAISAKNFIGWGGGSAMDAAKAVAAVCCAPEKCRDFFYGAETPPLRDNNLILLPTTAGTGAEITPNAVLLDTQTNIKQSLRAPGMAADTALIDPELLYDAPVSVISAGAFDSLTQALEGFVSLRATDFTRQLSLTAAALILPAILPGCSKEPAALTALSRGTMLGAMAFSSCGLGAVHGIAHPLGSILRLSHGLVCGILLHRIMVFNAGKEPELFDTLARGLDFSNAGELNGHIQWLRRSAGLPDSFREFGLKKEHFDFIVKNCRSGSMKSNPAVLTDSEVYGILETLI